MSPRHIRTMAVLLLSGLPFAGRALAQEEAHPFLVQVGATQRLQMTKKLPIQKSLNERPAVAKVSINGDAALVTGVAEGTTELILVGKTSDGKAEIEHFKVTVQTEIELLKDNLRRAIPTANIVPIAGPNNVIILTGWAPHNEDEVVRIARSLIADKTFQVINALGRDPRQVQLDVVLIWVPRNEGPGKKFQGTKLPLDSMLGHCSFATFPDADRQASFLALIDDEPIKGLRESRWAKRLSEVHLLTMSGRPATYLSGGGCTFLSIQFTPVPLNNGNIYLELELDETKLHHRQTRKVLMKERQTLLLRDPAPTSSTLTLPVLADFPLITLQENEDLLMIVTPHVQVPVQPWQPISTMMEMAPAPHAYQPPSRDQSPEGRDADHMPAWKSDVEKKTD